MASRSTLSCVTRVTVPLVADALPHTAAIVKIGSGDSFGAGPRQRRGALARSGDTGSGGGRAPSAVPASTAASSSDVGSIRHAAMPGKRHPLGPVESLVESDKKSFPLQPGSVCGASKAC